MEQFISEHGGVIVSGIVTIALLGNNNDSNLSCWKYGCLRDFKNNRGIVVEVFLEEHGEKYYIRINRAGYGSDHNSGNKQRHC